MDYKKNWFKLKGELMDLIVSEEEYSSIRKQAQSTLNLMNQMEVSEYTRGAECYPIPVSETAL